MKLLFFRTMSLVFILQILGLSLLCHAQNSESALSPKTLEDAFINDPAISSYCQEMLKDRKEKLQLIDRYKALQEKSKGLSKKVPRNKETLANKLTSYTETIDKRLFYFERETLKLEEQIIKAGCPGLSLPVAKPISF